MDLSKKILVILGPTATKKTDLALQLAKKFNGELVSADSRQVYKGLDIGTGKIPTDLRFKNDDLRIKKDKGWWEVNGIRIWMYDVVSPKKQYNVASFVKDAEKVIEKIRKKGKLPIVVGGTGLYLKALIDGLFNLAIPQDLNLRNRLKRLSVTKLQRQLQKLSPAHWQQLNISDRQNPRRLSRSIELIKMYPYIDNKKKIISLSEKNDILKIGLTAPRLILYQKVNNRVTLRIREGMVEEAKKMHEVGLSFKRMKQLGLEYGVMADYLQGKIKTDELISRMQGKIHGFVRRQLTWFKKEKNVNWFDITNKNYPIQVEILVTKWYD